MNHGHTSGRKVTIEIVFKEVFLLCSITEQLHLIKGNNLNQGNLQALKDKDITISLTSILTKRC